MFKLVRYFSITSAVAVVLATIVVTLVFRQYSIEKVVSLAESRNVTLAQSFANTIWPQFSVYLTTFEAADGELARTSHETRQLHDLMATLTAGLPVLKVKFFSPAGLAVYSTDTADIGQTTNSSPGFKVTADEGTPSSTLSHRDTFNSIGGPVANRDLVETYLPIHSKDGSVAGVLELYSDVTPLMDDLQRTTVNLMVIVSLVFLAFYCILYFIVRNADNILRKQYTDLHQEIQQRELAEEKARESHDMMEYLVVERTAALRKEISERKRTQEELLQAQKMDALGHLTGGVAHEFNNLLMAIGGYSRLAREDPEDQELVKQCIGEVIKASDNAANLTSQMLAFARKQPMEKKTVRVSRILRDLRPILGPLMGENVGMSLDISDEDACATVDPSQLSQAVLNLSINGCQAMANGGHLVINNKVRDLDEEAVSKHLQAEPGKYNTISVIDTGTGIPEEVLPHIFDPFFTTKEPGKGTGLGLSMVYGMAEQCGGFVDVESEPGSGTIFTIYLPFSEQREDTVVDCRPVTRQTGIGTVLVAEDEKTVRNLAQTTLEKLGYTVITAEDGAKAASVFRTHSGQIDFLLTDVAMPNKNGYELARDLLSEKPDLRVIFMSGHGGEHMDIKAFGPRSKFLPKPFDPEVLGQMLGELMDA